jgi:hypothetical protein
MLVVEPGRDGCVYDVAALIAEIRSFMNAISAALSVRSIAAR